jgi:probable HAF family extracellular repeat protein
LFTSSGSAKLPKVAVWDGKQWSAPDWLPTRSGNHGEPSVGDPSEYGLRTIVAYQDAVYFGGSFRHVAGRPAENIARIGNGTSRPETEPVSAPSGSHALPAPVDLTNTKFRLTKVIPAARWNSGNLRFAAVSNSGKVAVANPTKIPVPVEVAAPLFEDNPFTRPKRGIPNDPHLIRERILLWDRANQEKSVTLPGGEPKYAWGAVCMSPDGKQLVATETRTLGSRSSYRWDGTRWQPIPRPQNHEVVIHGVNDSGLMVGTSDVGDPRNGQEAVVIRNGRTQVLPSPAHKAVALAVSNSGLIAGQALDKFGLAQACLWKDDQSTLLGTMGGKSSVAHAVNDSGTVVGLLRTSANQETAFVWQSGQMRHLLEPSSTISIAYGINNSGVIVGLAYGPKAYGFIASGEQVLNLNDLLLESHGWAVTRGVAINDENSVLAIAELESQEHLVLLTPST